MLVGTMLLSKIQKLYTWLEYKNVNHKTVTHGDLHFAQPAVFVIFLKLVCVPTTQDGLL